MCGVYTCQAVWKSLMCVLFVYNNACVWEEGGKEKEIEKRAVSEQ